MHTNPYVYNQIWERQGQRPPPPIDLLGGCTPCDHYNPKQKVRVPLDPNDPNRMHLLAHLQPPYHTRPGWDGEQLHPMQTRGTILERERQARAAAQQPAAQQPTPQPQQNAVAEAVEAADTDSELDDGEGDY